MEVNYFVIVGRGTDSSDAFADLEEKIEETLVDGVIREYIGGVSLTQISSDKFIAYQAITETNQHGR